MLVGKIRAHRGMMLYHRQEPEYPIDWIDSSKPLPEVERSSIRLIEILSMSTENHDSVLVAVRDGATMADHKDHSAAG